MWGGNSVLSLHEGCRKRYYSSSSLVKSITKEKLLRLTSSASTVESNIEFDIVNLCFFCGLPSDRSHKRVHNIISNSVIG